MKIKQNIKDELRNLITETDNILNQFIKSKKGNKGTLIAAYQKWFTPALQMIKKFSPLRYNEFKEYYIQNIVKEERERFNDAKTYTIQDYLIGIEPVRYTGYVGGESWKPFSAVEAKLLNQFEMIKSLESNIDSTLQNIHYEIYAEFQEAELEAAKKLKNSSTKAALVLASAVLKNHLSRVAEVRDIQTTISSPTLNDLIELLVNNNIIDFQQQKKLKYYEQIISKTNNQTEIQPSDVSTIISGTEEVINTIF